MSFRRRQRWLRRLALGFALATAVAAGNASYAFAKVDEGGSGSHYVSTPGWSGLVDNESGVPLAAGIPEGDEQFIAGETQELPAFLAAKDKIETRAEQPQQVIPYLSHGILTESMVALPEWQMIPYEAYGRLAAASTTARPDDVADRFAHSDVTAQPQLASNDTWTFERSDALMLVIGGIVLALGLGLALGYLSRPRLAGA